MRVRFGEMAHLERPLREGRRIGAWACKRFVRREIGEVVEFSALWRFARGDGYG